MAIVTGLVIVAPWCVTFRTAFEVSNENTSH